MDEIPCLINVLHCSRSSYLSSAILLINVVVEALTVQVQVIDRLLSPLEAQDSQGNEDSMAEVHTGRKQI